MKIHSLTCLALGLCMSLSLSAQRASISLDKQNWRTYLSKTSNTQPTSLDTIDVKLPHNWDDYYGYRQLTHGNLHGTAVYSTRFDMPAEWQADQAYFIRFEGVGTYAHVRLNGHDLGRHLGGRVSFTLDVTQAVKAKGNYLEVTAEHPDMITDMPCVCGGCSSEWGFSEGSQPLGIYRPVVLETTPKVRIEPFGVHVWNNDAANKIYYSVEVKNYDTKAHRITLSQDLFTPQAQINDKQFTDRQVDIPAGATLILQDSMAMPKAELWSHANPALYSLQTRVKMDGGAEDKLSTTFGIRSISWPVKRLQAIARGEKAMIYGPQGAREVDANDGRFYINGESLFLNGVCEYEHLLGQGHAFSAQQVEARVQQMLNAGFNAFRDAHQPHHLDYQKYWDKYGVMFWTQLSAHIWYDTPEFRANFKAQLRQWVKERRNCPSVVLWGLQNESTLPTEFAKECCEIIREMDPTAHNMRAITTCNGGTGTDWNVIQNWSGTYSGSPEKYDQELSKPSQLLNGEYGAWRTLDLHEEDFTFKQDGPYTEERFCSLMEMKVRLAEQAKDSVCGQFQWCYTSHDNPGRRQPDDAWRVMDRVGPVNYKGLVSPWEEPLDIYYMYRSHYVKAEDDPMVYIVSHTWPERFTEPKYKVDIHLFSNCDSVKLYNDAYEKYYLGTAVNPKVKGEHLILPQVLLKYNTLLAVAYVDGKAVAEDLVLYQALPEAPGNDKLSTRVLKASNVKSTAYNKHLLKAAKGYRYLYRINCGGDEYVDSYRQVWQQDNMLYSSSWSEKFEDMHPYQASQRRSYDPVYGTKDAALFQHFRFGRHQLQYRFALPNGTYRVELYFVEPWHGTGGANNLQAQRVFDVAFNGETLIDDLDIWSMAGHDAALKQVVEVEVKDGSLLIDFPEVTCGQAIVSAIAIASKSKAVAKAFKAPSYSHEAQMSIREAQLQAEKRSASFIRDYLTQWSWSKADEDRVARMPAERLPEDKNPRTKVNYPVAKAQVSGAYKADFQRKKDCFFFADTLALHQTQAAAYCQPEERDCVVFDFSVGLAQLYALRINYRNLSTDDLMIRLRLLASDGRVLKDAVLTFTPNDRGWKALSTTTGSYINAGDYKVVLSAPSLNGLAIESLDIQ